MCSRRRDREYREHVLTGFGDLVEWRAVQFLGSRPLRNVCDTCNIIARSVKVTLCQHFFCPLCYDLIVTGNMKCPIDNKEIAHEKVIDMELDRSYMDSYVARCFYASRGCGFEGPLSDVKRHFLEGCDFVQAKCTRCNKRIDRWEAVNHRAQCKFGIALEAAIESLESARTERCPENCPCGMMKSAAGAGYDGAASGDTGDDERAKIQRKYGMLPIRKPMLKKYLASAGSSLTQECNVDLSRLGYRGDEASGTSRDTPATSPSTDGARALPPTGKKTSPSRPTTLDVGERQAPRFTVEDIRRLSGGFVTGVACSKPWHGPTGGMKFFAEPVGAVLPSPPLEGQDSSLQGAMPSPADFSKSFKAAASPVSSAASEDLATADVAISHPEFAQAGPLGSEAAATPTENPPTPTRGENLQAIREEAEGGDFFTESTAGASKDAQEPETPPADTMTASSARAVEVPPCAAYVLADGLSTAESGEGDRVDANALGLDVSTPQDPPDEKTASFTTLQSQEEPGHETARRTRDNLDVLAETLTGLDIGLEGALSALSGTLPSVLPSLMNPTGASVYHCFIDATHVRHLLEGSDQSLIRSDEGMVAGYTFQLYCLLRRHGLVVSMAFEFFFTSGECDDFCQWPFDRKVVLQLVHPEHCSKNIRLPLSLSQEDAAAAFRKPERANSNPGCLSDELCWDEVEAAGFVAGGILRVDVMFE